VASASTNLFVALLSLGGCAALAAKIMNSGVKPKRRARGGEGSGGDSGSPGGGDGGAESCAAGESGSDSGGDCGGGDGGGGD